MKRVLTVGLLGLAGTAAVAAVTPVRELPATVTAWNAIADQAGELDKLAQLGESQRASTEDIVTSLADGRLSLAEAVAVLESNTAGRPVFLDQLALVRSEETVQARLSGYVLERAKERLGSDPGQVSALLARVGAEGK